MCLQFTFVVWSACWFLALTSRQMCNYSKFGSNIITDDNECSRATKYIYLRMSIILDDFFLVRCFFVCNIGISSAVNLLSWYCYINSKRDRSRSRLIPSLRICIHCTSTRCALNKEWQKKREKKTMNITKKIPLWIGALIVLYCFFFQISFSDILLSSFQMTFGS